MLSILNTTIKNINAKSIMSKSNHNIDNKINISTLDLSGAIIKNMNIKSIIRWANNNISIEINMGVFMDKIISKIDIKLIISRLYKANIIIRKDLYESSYY